MSIYEYDEKKHMKQVKEEGRQEMLLELVAKKLMKGKPLEVIADELEESIEAIQSLIEEIRENN